MADDGHVEEAGLDVAGEAYTSFQLSPVKGKVPDKK